MKGCRPLNKIEYDKMLESFYGRWALRNKTIFILGCKTGFRISEILSLKIGDVVDANGNLTNRVEVKKQSMKRKKESRSVLLNKEAGAALAVYLGWLKDKIRNHSDMALFPTEKGISINRKQYWAVIKNAARIASVNGRVATHTMRKTFANNVYDFLLEKVSHGAQIDAFRSTSKALGHKEISSTDKYLSFREETIEEAVNNI